MDQALFIIEMLTIRSGVRQSLIEIPTNVIAKILAKFLLVGSERPWSIRICQLGAWPFAAGRQPLNR